jgi:thiamine biosynthesis lipoprotein
MTAATTFRAWSCTVRLVVGDARALTAAAEDLTALLERVDAAASRFRADSELSRANAAAGRPLPISPLFVDLVAAGLEAARRTDGAVTPCVGHSLRTIGYDRDIAAVAPDAGPVPEFAAAGGWRGVRLNRAAGLLTVPIGSALDLGATAKAWTADHAAESLARRYDTAVLVELGGDLAVAGERPDGWCIKVAERQGDDGPLILVRRGGIATSTTAIRAWRRGGMRLHHIVDPRTGRPADGPWRTASVAAPSAFDANVASTNAIVLGEQAVPWLENRRLPARLVHRDGSVRTTAGWPPARSDTEVA